MSIMNSHMSISLLITVLLTFKSLLNYFLNICCVLFLVVLRKLGLYKLMFGNLMTLPGIDAVFFTSIPDII